MANALYDAGRENFLTGTISWSGNTIRVYLVDAADYTVDLALHDFIDDVPAAARVGQSPALSSKTTTDGIADAADVTLSDDGTGTGGVTGDEAEALVIYEEDGTEATSTTIAYIDTATGLPVTPNGGDITVQWDDGTNKIFKL